MKTVFMPSKNDYGNVYWNEVESEETVILMRSLVYKINQKMIKVGAKFTHIDPTLVSPKKEKKSVEG